MVKAGASVIVAIGMILVAGAGALATGTQSFGASTRGGSAGAVVRVTNLDDSGPGSLRDAVAGDNRTVVFDVAGSIVLTSEITIRGSFITVDGPAPRTRASRCATQASSCAAQATTSSFGDSASGTRDRTASG